MKSSIPLALVALTLNSWQATGQSSGLVYHSVGPVAFTNSTAFGYADGQAAGTNFYCGLYAGTDADSLEPYFIADPSFRQRLRIFRTTFYGNVTLNAPANSPIYLQFKIWSSDFDTYEAALASGTPTPPLGITGISSTIPPNIILEFPIAMGQVWLEPIPEPTVISLLSLASAGFAVLIRFRSRPRPG